MLSYNAYSIYIQFQKFCKKKNYTTFYLGNVNVMSSNIDFGIVTNQNPYHNIISFIH